MEIQQQPKKKKIDHKKWQLHLYALRILESNMSYQRKGKRSSCRFSIFQLFQFDFWCNKFKRSR